MRKGKPKRRVLTPDPKFNEVLSCNCGRKTIINARIDANGNLVEQGAQVEIGGDDRYVAVCRKCWRNKRIEQSRRASLPFLDEELDPEPAAAPVEEGAL